MNFIVQIDATGVDSSTMGEATQTRDLDAKVSNFGALTVGNRRGDDYTKTPLGFADKDNLSNKTPDFQEAERDQNPYVEGSTLKRVRDDQFMRMGMDSERDVNPSEPKFDISDNNLRSAVGMEAGKNYPTEGYISFGKKNLFSKPYQG